MQLPTEILYQFFSLAADVANVMLDIRIWNIRTFNAFIVVGFTIIKPRVELLSESAAPCTTCSYKAFCVSYRLRLIQYILPLISLPIHWCAVSLVPQPLGM